MSLNPYIQQNTWHLLSPQLEQTPFQMFESLYPNSVVLFDKIYSVNSGWNLNYPYLGQIQNSNWSIINNNTLNPYFGYWMKITSIYNAFDYSIDFHNMKHAKTYNSAFNPSDTRLRIEYFHDSSNISITNSNSISYDNRIIINESISSDFYVGTAFYNCIRFNIVNNSILITPPNVNVYSNSVDTESEDRNDSNSYTIYPYYHFYIPIISDAKSDIYINSNDTYTQNDWTDSTYFNLHNSSKNSGMWEIQVFDQSFVFYISTNEYSLKYDYNVNSHCISYEPDIKPFTIHIDFKNLRDISYNSASMNSIVVNVVPENVNLPGDVNNQGESKYTYNSSIVTININAQSNYIVITTNAFHSYDLSTPNIVTTQSVFHHHYINIENNAYNSVYINSSKTFDTTDWKNENEFVLHNSARDPNGIWEIQVLTNSFIVFLSNSIDIWEISYDASAHIVEIIPYTKFTYHIDFQNMKHTPSINSVVYNDSIHITYIENESHTIFVNSNSSLESTNITFSSNSSNSIFIQSHSHQQFIETFYGTKKQIVYSNCEEIHTVVELEISKENSHFFVGSSHTWVEFSFSNNSITTKPNCTMVHHTINFENLTGEQSVYPIYPYYYISLDLTSTDPNSLVFTSQNNDFTQEWSDSRLFVLTHSVNNWEIQVSNSDFEFYIGNNSKNWIYFSYSHNSHTLYIEPRSLSRVVSYPPWFGQPLSIIRTCEYPPWFGQPTYSQIRQYDYPGRFSQPNT